MRKPEFNISGIRSLMLVAALLVLAGCATKQARVDQFAAFAATGTAFTKAVDPALTASFDATATTNSMVLLQARDALPSSDRLTALRQADADLDARLAILGGLRRHLGVLQSYFDALASLAATTAESSGMTAVAQGFVNDLGKLNPAIAKATIGGNTVESLIAPAADFLYVAHQSNVLNAELKRNAPTIDRELRLMSAALQALATQYASDLGVVAEKNYRDKIALPFAGSGSLDASWSDQRAALLQSTLDTTSLQAAANAATSLRTSFVALVENRLTPERIAALQTDLGSILTTIENGRAAKAAKETQQ